MYRIGLKGPTRCEGVPRFYIMIELSCFVDESGDFGKYEKHSPYYLLTLVFHEQSKSIELKDFVILDKKLQKYFPEEGSTRVHTGPIIRREYEFQYVSKEDRRHIINALATFAYKMPITYTTIVVDKRLDNGDNLWLQSQIIKQLNRIIDDNLQYLLSFDDIKVYYDLGQKEISTILHSVFNTRFSNVVFKNKDIQNYRLAQIADLICTFELLHIKHQHKAFTKSELEFFHTMREFNMNYYKTIKKKNLYSTKKL